jgi:hypothetical protein
MADGSEGMAEFEDALAQSATFSLPMAEKAIGISLAAIQAQISPYPPQPARDRAKTFNTYVRGIGRFPRSDFEYFDSQWLRKPRNAYKRGKRGGKVRYTSQKMSQKYRLTVAREVEGGVGVTGELRNDATYSGWVVGSKDTALIPHQVAPHTLTGWPNADDAIVAAQPDIDAAFSEALDSVVLSLVKGIS